MGSVTPISGNSGCRLTPEKLAKLPIIDEIDEMIREKVSFKDIAKYVHETFELLTEHDILQVEKAINSRSRSMPPAALSEDEWPAAHSPKGSVRTPGKLSYNQYRRAAMGVDKLIELESLYLSQRDRIDKKIRYENDTGGFLEDMPVEYRTARELIREMAEIEKEFGSSMSRMKVSLEIQGASTDLGQKVAGIMEDPESRHKVISMFKRMTQASKLPIVDAEHELLGD